MGVRPNLHQFRIILGNEFLDVRDNADPHERIVFPQFFENLGNDQALAAAGRDDDQSIATPSLPVLICGINAFTLILAQSDHFFSPSMNITLPGIT